MAATTERYYYKKIPIEKLRVGDKFIMVDAGEIDLAHCRGTVEKEAYDVPGTVAINCCMDKTALKVKRTRKDRRG